MTRLNLDDCAAIVVHAAPSVAGVVSPSLRHSAHSLSHLGGRFVETAQKQGERPFIVTGNAAYSYHWSLTAAQSVAERLQNDDTFAAGNRVILLLPNSPEYIAGFYGAMLADAVVVPLPPDIEEDRLSFILKSTSTSHLLTSAGLLESRPHGNSGDFDRLELGAAHVSADSVLLDHSDSSQRLAAIFFTSGSSGQPKGVMLSHENLISNAQSICSYLPIDAAERPLCLLPFYHAFGNSIVQSHMLAGATLVLDGSLTFPESIPQAILHHEATSLSGVPEFFRFLLERSSLGSKPLSSLRYMAVAGGALDYKSAIALADKIHPAELFLMYGQTEATARLSYLPYAKLRELPNCIGQPIPQVDLQVVDQEDQPVAPGEVGEIRARGPNMMLGYWLDPDATARVVRDGWLYTGDLATVDEAGWLYVKGRGGQLVKVAGNRVHPVELEEFVTTCKSVSQAVAVAFQRPGLGTRLAVFVRAHDTDKELDVGEILAECRQRLPRYKVPDHIECVDDFPRTDNLKIGSPSACASSVKRIDQPSER